MAKFAIVVGINEYKKQGDLLYAESDALEFATALIRYCGFSKDEVVLLTNGGERVELADVQAQFDRAKESGELESFVFMFCGRGRLDKDRTTRRYCFSDADEGELFDSSFTLGDLFERSSGIHAANALFFFDARSFEEEYATKRELEALEKFADDFWFRLKNMSMENPNVLAINSCSDGQTSYDDAEYKRGLAASHLTWILKGFFTVGAPNFQQLSERLPDVVEERSNELRVGVKNRFQGVDFVAQRPFCKLVGDGVDALTTQTISDEERADAVREILERSERFFASGEYKRARLAAERALELEPNNESAQSLKSRAYCEEVSRFVGNGDFFSATNALVKSDSSMRRNSFAAFRKGLRLFAARVLDFPRWLTSFRKEDKGSRRWKACAWILCCCVLYGLYRGAIWYYDVERDESRVLQPGDWDGEFAGDRQFLTIGETKFPFRYCPPGSFKMGSPWCESERHSDERRHKVELTKGFWILETETTQAMWREVCGGNISYFEGDDLPVDQPSWYDCQHFVEEINKLGVAPKGWKFSLPTEAQWEYACRANESESRVMRRIDEYAWYWGTTATETHKVGEKKPNAWGIYDMRGNVWEWVADVYAPFLGNTVVDPQGPPEREGAMRVLRGGCWGGEVSGCRAAARYCYFASYGDSYRGFRIVLIQDESRTENPTETSAQDADERSDE